MLARDRSPEELSARKKEEKKGTRESKEEGEKRKTEDKSVVVPRCDAMKIYGHVARVSSFKYSSRPRQRDDRLNCR